MASEGLLALPAGIALALGANIGTAATTALMGIMSAKSTDAVRASAVHVMFNVLGTAIWLPFTWLLVEMAVWMSPASSELEGMAQAAAEVPRQIANANTIFNVINTLLFIGFTNWFARMAERLVPDRPPAEVIGTDIVALSRRAIDLNTTSGEKTRKMLLEVYEMVAKSVELTVQAVRDNDQRAAESVMIMKDGIRDQSERLLARKADRLTVDDPDYLDLVRLEMSFVDQMRRIYTLAKRISKDIVPPVIAQRD
jgi:phosphate:Na+ symporter